MELLNATKMVAGYTMGMKPDGRELLVVVVKGTFSIPADPDRKPRLLDEQLPLVMADEFTGEPGFSAPTCEADFAPHKPNCEVLLNGSACAPDGRPVERVPVALSVGSLHKSFDVVGDRTWSTGLLGVAVEGPEPFETMPISYDTAFGGIDDTHSDAQKHAVYAANPVGAGFHQRPNDESIIDRPLPNTEQTDTPVTNPRGKYQPMSFGPLARSWPPRLGYAGTYDEQWQEEQFPFLPADFDERYYQSAPEDQQLDALNGNDLVELTNLTPDGHRKFRLPDIRVPIEFVRRDFDSVEEDARLDTLLIDTDKQQFSLLWRAVLPLRQNMFEVNMVVAGKMPRGWYRARKLGKTYYSNLNELVLEQNG
ncbi:MAG: DUF2169 domain-containing protein [Planctomycetaceae bacterium]